MNLERTKPETLAAGVMDYMPSQSALAHEYAERLNAALARLGLTDRLTLPPAPNTAIDELPAVVDVPLRKTLSVLMGKAQQGDASALATLEWTAQVAESIFAGLHARDFAGDRPLALPSHESLATLSQGVDALLPRKISNGAWSLLADGTPSDGIDDGVSLVRLFCTDAIDSVTELKDDNEGWVMTKALIGFPKLKKISIQGSGTMSLKWFTGMSDLEELVATNISAYNYTSAGNDGATMPAGVSNLANLKKVDLRGLGDAMVSGNGNQYASVIAGCPALKEVWLGRVKGTNGHESWGTTKFYIQYCHALEKLSVETMSLRNCLVRSGQNENLLHLEIRGTQAESCNLNWWNPTSVLSDSAKLPIFLSNFKTYIAERLTDKGSGLTLTLSQAVRDAIEGDPTIAQIITSKGWTISPAPIV